MAETGNQPPFPRRLSGNDMHEPGTKVRGHVCLESVQTDSSGLCLKANSRRTFMLPLLCPSSVTNRKSRIGDIDNKQMKNINGLDPSRRAWGFSMVLSDGNAKLTIRCFHLTCWKATCKIWQLTAAFSQRSRNVFNTMTIRRYWQIFEEAARFHHELGRSTTEPGGCISRLPHSH